MTEVYSDKRLKLLEGTFVSASISGGIVSISAALLQVNAMTYLLLAIGAAMIAGPFLGVSKRVVNYIAARRGPLYVGYSVVLLPTAIMLAALLLGAFLWLGISSGILDIEDYLIPILGVITTILINIAILIYNVVGIRGNG